MTVRWPRLLTPTHLSQIIRKQKNPLTALQMFKEAKYKYPNYCHNGPVYATLIGILGNAGKICEMKEVIDWMKEDSCECKDSVFVNAIKTYARAGLVNEAVSLFKSIPQFNCVHRTESFNTLLQILINESKLEAAHRLFLENSYGWEVKYRIRSLNLLMDALCQRSRSDLALPIFLEMNYQGCYPSRESYRILMKGLCEDGRLNEATHLLYSMFWRISQKGSGEDIVIYRTLLYALCDNGQVEMAVAILGKILRKGLKAPKRCFAHIVLNRCSAGEDIEDTKRLINEALIRGGIPSLASYKSMAIDLYNEGKISEANKVLYTMQERGFRPTNLIYETKVAALCRGGNVDAAVKVIEEEMEGNCVPNVRAYNILLKGLCNEGKSVIAVDYLKKMAKKLGCVADKETYGILINGLCRESRYLEASQVLQEMLIKSYWPCVDTYNILIRGLCSMSRQYEAVLWLEEMVSQGMKPELSVWNSLVASVCSNMADIEVCSQTCN
ncbi:pentatricopeptide repeat-containing protein At1g05600-like [Fagus crenata]